MAVCTAHTNKEKRMANKTLKSAIRSTKQEWANDFLKDATMDKLWMAASWRHGRHLKSIPALNTKTGLSNDPGQMSEALRNRFFKNPPHNPSSDQEDGPIFPQRGCPPITESEIAEALKPTSNSSAPGKSGHGYKLVKWAWGAALEWFVLLFNSCLFAGYHPKA